MPKVIGYTAPWISRPSAGSRIFSDPAPQSPTSPLKPRATFLATDDATTYQGPRRLIANRGTEIFTVVGNTIRWADLATVKDDWTEQKHSERKSATSRASAKEDVPVQYRTLSAPVYYQIRQLIISPSGVFLAICTEHTVHIAVLPDSSRLSDSDRSPLKLKTYQLGPTTHVIPEPPVVSALWHPLAVATDSTDCFVTVTSEAAVRMWEVDRSSRASFERPALAIDLKRLVDGVSSDEDFEPSGFGKSRGFSVDAFDMEASAACFGGQGLDEENAWASMTLWTSMRNGDVYALCPLLPSRWIPSSTTIPSLSTASVAKLAMLGDGEASGDAERAAKQQYEWVQEIDSSEPVDMRAQDDDISREIRLRPSNPGVIPQLQGPFDLPLEEDLEISDIHVFAAQIDDAELMSGEEGFTDSEAEDGLPFTLICLATTNGDVRIAMDVDGVSGKWLPKRSRNTFSVPEPDVHELVLIETLSGVVDVSPQDLISSWPVFTPDTNADYSLFLTGSKQIATLTFGDWAARIAAETSSSSFSDAGIEMRLKTMCSSQICVYDELLNIMDSANPAEEGENLTAPVVFDDAELGYMLVTATESQAFSLSFDTAHSAEVLNFEPFQSQRSQTSFALNMSMNSVPDTADAPVVPQRAPYAPSKVLYKSTTGPLKEVLTKNLPQRQRMTLTQPIRLSPATLDLMTSAHRMLSSQTKVLDRAAAELFRQCDRMREELADQVKQMTDLADKLQNLGRTEDGEESSSSISLEERIDNAREKQARMQKRFEDLRRKSGRAKGKKELSEKEVAWIDEIGTLGRIVGLGEHEPQVGGSGGLGRRYEQLQHISKELLAESKKIAEDSETQEKTDISSPGGTALTNLHMSSKVQKCTLADAMAMVEREAAVIEAVQARLQKLTLECSV
jgi:nucleoporin NUP82